MPESARATAVKTEAKVEKATEQNREREVRPHPLNLHSQLLYQQRTIGNRVVQRFIKSGLLQEKQTLSHPNDIHEQEADWVMRMPEPMVQPRPLNITTLIQRQEKEEEEKPFQLSQLSRITPQVESSLTSLKGGGQPLDSNARAFFEPRFGDDFSQVRIHTDPRAAETAQALNAKAFTVFRDIVFGTGQYAPDTSAGRQLIAHELTHVLQQEAGQTPVVQRACGPAAIGTPASCTNSAPVFLSNYPKYTFLLNCDDFAPGEEVRLISDATALPASAVFEIHGYASMSGAATFNQNLSCARALKARTVLTNSAPAGAGIAESRITGIFNHGPTPGPGADRRSVVVAPPTPTPLPTAVSAAGPSDFQINRVGDSTRSQIYFRRGVSTLDPVLDDDALSQIAAIRSTPPGAVNLIGHASADETPTMAQGRANTVRAALTAPPSPVSVTSAVGNAASTANRSDFTEARHVEIVPSGAPPVTLDCAATDALGNPVNPPTQPCPIMDPATDTAFASAHPIAVDAMTRAVNAVTAPSPQDESMIDRFFGNHNPATLLTLQTNLVNLQIHVNNLLSITQCGGQCDVGGCDEGPIAYHTPADAPPPPAMTLCVPVFKGMHVNDQVRNLIHESAHGTAGMGGTPTKGTRDVAYRHERMLFQLSTADRLRNSDSYALFALYIREMQLTGIPGAIPAGIATPARDTLTGFGTNQPALELALARLEKRLSWAKDWTGQLYGEVVDVRSGTRTWATSWARDLMREAAARFPLTAPPTAPTLVDQTRVAAILDRYKRMKQAVKRDLTVSAMAAGVVSWASTGAAWVANNALQIGPDFFRATQEHQVSLLLEAVAQATRDVEPAFVPAYVTLAEWIHRQNP